MPFVKSKAEVTCEASLLGLEVEFVRNSVELRGNYQTSRNEESGLKVVCKQLLLMRSFRVYFITLVDTVQITSSNRETKDLVHPQNRVSGKQLDFQFYLYQQSCMCLDFDPTLLDPTLRVDDP